MNRPIKLMILFGSLTLLLVGVVFFIIPHPSPLTHRSMRQATYYCPMHPSYTSDRPGDCPICNMRLVQREDPTPTTSKDICYLHHCEKLHEGRPCPMTVVAKEGETVICPVCGKYVAGKDGTLNKVLYWTDPMIPNYRADGPGTSPMGMDLVPVYAEEAPGTPSALAPEGYAPVLLTPAKQQLIGVMTAPVIRRSLTKHIRTVGRIAYDPELYQTQAEYLQSLKSLKDAEARSSSGLEEAKRLVESSRMKLILLGLNEELIDEMAEWEGPDKKLLLADATGAAWVYAPIYEFELPMVKARDTISVEIPSVPGLILEGTIRSIDPVLDAMTRTARIRAVLTAPPGTLKPEMYVNVSIMVEAGEVLAVPEGAVFDTGEKRIVFIDKGQGVFEPRDITVGLKTDEYYEVKKGLAEGERVVTSGNFLIDSESRLKAAFEGTGSSSGHQHGQ